MGDHQYTYSVLHLPRWEVSIPIAREGNVWYVPIRRMCKAIGVDPQNQFTVINKRYETKREVPFQAENGAWRMFLSLPSDDAALWVAGINPERCKFGTRDTLEAFIDEAKKALEAKLFKRDYIPLTEEDAKARIEQRRSYDEKVLVCDCGRHWRIISEDGEHRMERVTEQEW